MKKQEEVLKNQKADINKMFALLPKLLQHRIELFRKFSPNFQSEDEFYELTTVFLANKIYHHCKAKDINNFASNVDKFDIDKYTQSHWLFSKIDMTINQVEFAKCIATSLFRDAVEQKMDIGNPDFYELQNSLTMKIPDALSPLRPPLCWPREGYIKDYIKLFT